MQFKVNDRVFVIKFPQLIGTVIETDRRLDLISGSYIKVKLDNFYIPRFYLPKEIAPFTKFYHYAI